MPTTKRITATGSQAIDIRGTGGNTPVRQQNPESSDVPITEAEMHDVLSTRAATLFRDDYPEYQGSPENSKKMVRYVEDNGLDPYLISSWSTAFQALTLAGQLDTVPDEPRETSDEFQPRPIERHLNGSVLSFHDPVEIEALKKIDLQELGKIVKAETSKKRAVLQRKGIRF
jgi:hypothetical protein